MTSPQRPKPVSVWIPEHFTKDQTDLLMDLKAAGQDGFASRLLEATPPPPPPKPSQAGRKANVSRDDLVAWMMRQGPAWNVHLKQADSDGRRALILQALNDQESTDKTACNLLRHYHPQDQDRPHPFDLNATRKELRDRLATVAQEEWGNPIVIPGETPEQTLKWLLG